MQRKNPDDPVEIIVGMAYLVNDVGRLHRTPGVAEFTILSGTLIDK